MAVPQSNGRAWRRDQSDLRQDRDEAVPASRLERGRRDTLPGRPPAFPLPRRAACSRELRRAIDSDCLRRGECGSSTSLRTTRGSRHGLGSAEHEFRIKLMRRHNKKATPLLVGRIVFVPVPGSKNDARIRQLHVWCPHCKKHHIHGWKHHLPNDEVEHRIAHCESGPFYKDGYYIGCEPGRRDNA